MELHLCIIFNLYIWVRFKIVQKYAFFKTSRSDFRIKYFFKKNFQHKIKSQT